MLRLRLVRALACASLVCLPALVAAQNHDISPGSTSGLPGATVTVPLLLDNDEPVRGFSLGMTHDAAIVTLDTIAVGSALASVNGGGGPAFFTQDVAAPNGTGGTCGAVLSLAPPLEDVPVGSDHEIALFTYTITAAALPGSSSALTVVSTLGNPPLLTAVSVNGVTRIPTSSAGSIAVETPPVSAVTCTLIDPCLCDFTVSWTNGASYDAIDVFEDGVLAATLPGTATSTTVSVGATTIGGPASATVTIVGRSNATDAAGVSCLADCPDVPDPLEPIGLTCTVDPFTGLASLSWANPQIYSGLEVSIDGVPQAVLAGSDLSTTVTLSAPGTYTLCLDGTDECGVGFATVCCTAVFEQVFTRGDVNLDGGFNISDPVFALNYLFLSGPLSCEKSADTNDSGTVNIADVVHMLQGIFGQGPLPEVPFAACGVDPSADLLTCAAYSLCP